VPGGGSIFVATDGSILLATLQVVNSYCEKSFASVSQSAAAVFRQYMKLTIERTIGQMSNEQVLWQDWEVFVRELDALQKHTHIPFLGKDNKMDFTPIINSLLASSQISPAEKRNILINYPFLRYKDGRFNDEVAGFLIRYYVQSGFQDEEIKNIPEIKSRDDSLHNVIYDQLAEPVRKALETGDYRFLDQLELTDDDLWKIVDRCKLSGLAKLALLDKSIEYSVSHRKKPANITNAPERMLMMDYWNELEYRTEVTTDIREQTAKILEAASIRGVDTGSLGELALKLLYFTGKGYLSATVALKTYSFEKLTHAEKDILLRLISSKYLKEIHMGKLKYYHGDAERGDAEPLKQDENGFLERKNISAGTWSEAMLEFAMPFFLEKIGFSGDMQVALTGLQEMFDVHLGEYRKLQQNTGSVFSSGLDMMTMSHDFMDHKIGKSAKDSVSKKYEPVLRKLFALPFYADRTDFSETKQAFFEQYLGAILNSGKSFEEILETAKTYLPEGRVRSFVLFALLLREIEKEDTVSDNFTIDELRVIVEKNDKLAEKVEMVLPYLSPDLKMFFNNSIMLKYLQDRVKGNRQATLGATDALNLRTIVEEEPMLNLAAYVAQYGYASGWAFYLGKRFFSGYPLALKITYQFLKSQMLKKFSQRKYNGYIAGLLQNKRIDCKVASKIDPSVATKIDPPPGTFFYHISAAL